MALLKYFQKLKQPNPIDVLPDENGPLCQDIPSSSIREANLEVSEVLTTQTEGKRKPYLKISSERKAVIGKYAAENGIVSALVHFAPEFPDNTLKESTVRGWKKGYLMELARRKKSGDDLSVKVLPTAKMGRPLNLGVGLDKQVQSYLLAVREGGGRVTTDLAIAAGTGLVRKKDSNLLAKNGGHIALTRDWARSLLDRMGFVKRKANTKVKVLVEDFEKLKSQFLFDIETFTSLKKYQKALCLIGIRRQSGMFLCQTGPWIKKGPKK